MRDQTRTTTVVSILAGTALVALSASGCSSPEATAAKFCKLHAAQEAGKAHALLAKADRKETMKMDYVDFQWDQKTFDVHILRGGDQCSATIRKADETAPLAEIKVTIPRSTKSFSCVLPLVKEGETWMVTNHWKPMEDLLAAIKAARAKLTADLTGMNDKAEAEYKTAAAAAMAAYWKVVDDGKKAVTDAAGGSFPAFCAPNLNLDGGLNLAFEYLALQDRGDGPVVPKHVTKTTAEYKAHVDVLRAGYTPLATSVQNDARVDLISSSVVKTEEGDQVRNLILFWGGDVAPPFSWMSWYYNAEGAETHTARGSDLEEVKGITNYIPCAPTFTMVVLEFPKLPAGTAKLDISLTGSFKSKLYKLSIPVKPEFLKKES